jgi:sarcosine/dimethylglycine N-methyltransferase
MNIADKDKFYAEVYRVLKPDGRFAMYDIVAGPGGELNFPVPWARDASASFLIQPDEMRTKLEESGFTVMVWNDVTPLVYDWYRRLQSRATSGSPRLDRKLLLGPDYAVMLQNQQKNLAENRYGLLQAIVQK